MDYTIKFSFNKDWLKDWLIIDNDNEMDYEQYLKSDRDTLLVYLENNGFNEYLYTMFDFYTSDTRYDITSEPFSSLERAIECKDIIAKTYGKFIDLIRIVEGE